MEHGVTGQIVMEIASKREYEIKTKQMKQLSHVTVKVSVFSMSRMILTEISKLVPLIKIGQNGTFQNRSLGYQMVLQHIQDLYPMLFDLFFKHLINFILIPRHAFT